MIKVSKLDWPPQDEWPKSGWKHTLAENRFRVGGVFGWHEGGFLWSGIVEEVGYCCVKIRNVLPGVLE